MNRKLILLNLLLAALAIVLVWQIRARWMDAKARENAVLARATKAPNVVVPPSPPPVEAGSPADYIEVAQKTLFSKDRDPEVVVVVPEPPKPPDPPPPPMPSYHGQMNFNEPVILLSTTDAKQKAYRIGDTVGEFKLAAFDREKVTFEWKSKSLERNLADLRPKEDPKAVVAAAQAPGQQPGAAKPAQPPKPSGPPQLGPQVGSFRQCVATDGSPAGTVLDGYRKVMSVGLMGPECHWEQIK